ncbi:MAG: DUF6763 family protein [Thiohalomonadales bacterium]
MMPTPFEPNIGQCYRDQQGRSFEVVAMDDLDVEIQYHDGEVDEFDIDTWYLLNVKPADVTKDWSCSSRNLLIDDLDIDVNSINMGELDSEEFFEEL